MGMSTYLQKAILNHITGKIPYTQPTGGVFLGLHTSAAGDYVSEVNKADYSRVKIELTDPSSSTTLVNISDVVFNEATSSWGTINSVGIYDSLTGGNLLFSTDLTIKPNITIGSQLVFKKNYILLSLS